jgi:hypothetical protein
MNLKKIIIPNPSGDAMGASVASLLEVLEQWAQIVKGDEISIDMKALNFVHPFFVLPLCALISSELDRDTNINFEYSAKIESYLNTIYFPKGFSATGNNDWGKKITGYGSKSYLPACKFPVTSHLTALREQFLTTFEQILIKQLNLQGQIITAIKYLISEAIDNITDHSGVPNGWIMVQNYPNKGYLDVCIADTGKGIAGSYLQCGNVGAVSDALALEFAVNGKSTKNSTVTRGYGIDTSRRMLVDGLNGKYFLFSGKAFYIYTKELEQITPLPDFGWQGALLALQIPSMAPKAFNYTTFLE